MTPLPSPLRDLIAAIPPISHAARDAAAKRQDQLTKPQGSLGRLEELSIRLAGMTANPRPRFASPAVIVGAGDHGICAEGVSAFPSEVTPQMVANFLAGGAAINVLSRQAGARVVVVDFGVAADLSDTPGLVHARIAAGTQNFARGMAMTREQALEAILAGAEVVTSAARQSLDLVAVGEMGIGNTTPASALTTVFTGQPVAKVTGRGTGISDAALAHKIDVIERALALHQLDAEDPLGVLAAVGGFEIAGLAGVMLAAAARRIPVVLDGFITGSAALVAARLAPAVTDYMVASHVSVECGHPVILDNLGIVPLFNLDLRLGEGSGAALALPMVRAAAAILDEMATFDEAGVSEGEP
ncbi:MAG TPA: nicotinate-nucleotide--dimethylbenzimidazole phosphoribosyltransferase [Tepidiformaceae bacterium]